MREDITWVGDGGADEPAGDAFGGDLIPGVVADGVPPVVQVEDAPAHEHHLALELLWRSLPSQHLGSITPTLTLTPTPLLSWLISSGWLLLGYLCVPIYSNRRRAVPKDIASCTRRRLTSRTPTSPSWILILSDVWPAMVTTDKDVLIWSSSCVSL